MLKRLFDHHTDRVPPDRPKNPLILRGLSREAETSKDAPRLFRGMQRKFAYSLQTRSRLHRRLLSPERQSKTRRLLVSRLRIAVRRRCKLVGNSETGHQYALREILPRWRGRFQDFPRIRRTGNLLMLVQLFGGKFA